jgi:hypothetical protein
VFPLVRVAMVLAAAIVSFWMRVLSAASPPVAKK